jgi:hypothetical protein
MTMMMGRQFCEKSKRYEKDIGNSSYTRLLLVGHHMATNIPMLEESVISKEQF